MSEWKVTASHRSRAAVIYVRQSTLVQVERNRESTARQYDLVSRARELGWPRTAVTVIDEDLGISGASAAGPGSRSWPPRSAWGRSGSCCRWSARGWPATTPTGTGCWVRHEALCIRVEMEGLRRRAVAAVW
jgi:hypothetical protein